MSRRIRLLAAGTTLLLVSAFTPPAMLAGDPDPLPALPDLDEKELGCAYHCSAGLLEACPGYDYDPVACGAFLAACMASCRLL